MSRYSALYLSSAFCKTLALALLLLLPGYSFAASLFMTPSSGVYEVGNTFSVGIAVEASDTAFNAVSGTLSFPAGSVEVVSLSKAASAISLWVQEPSFSNGAGTVSFEGIVLNPGYKGSNARILTVQFRAKKEGTVPLSFSSSEVLANDGVGTNILTAARKGNYTLTAKATPPPPSEPVVDSAAPSSGSVAETPSAPNVTSESHKVNSWSNQTSGTFSFGFGGDVTALRLLLDDISDSTPAVVYQPPIAERLIKDLEEGSSYLHVQYKNSAGWGEIAHYPLQVDTKPPTSLDIINVDNKTFTFTAVDELSGIDRFEISLSGGDTQHVSAVDGAASYTVQPQQAGRQVLLVKAFDKAGNFIQASEEFVTEGSPAETVGSITSLPQTVSDFGKVAILALSLIIPLLALLGLLTWLLFFSWKIFGGFKRRIKKETDEAKSAVRKSFGLLLEDLGEDVKMLEKAGKKRPLTKEEVKVLKRLQKHIALTEAFIYKEISDIEDEVKNMPDVEG